MIVAKFLIKELILNAKEVDKMKKLCSIVGVVSIVLLFVMAPVNVFADSFSVYAKDNSSNGGEGLHTGLSFSAGDLFTVSVDPNDLWNAGDLPRWSNADGLVGNLYATGTDESLQPAGTLIGQNFGLLDQNGLSAPYGALVGEIEDNYFLLGTNFVGAAPASGELELYYWDSNSYDNTESLAAVNVTVNAAPEPTTLLLLGLGLIGLAGGRRKFRK